MDYKNFLLEIQKEVMEYLPEQYQDVEATIQKVKKNNDTELMALLLHRPGEAVSPQVYLEHAFEEYQKGRKVEEIAKDLADSYLQNQTLEIPNVADMVSDLNKVQGFLRLQLVNKEYNSEKLQDTPHRDLENTDLTAILRIYLPTPELGEATILVSDELLSIWKKNMDDLYPIALQNTMLASPARIDSMMHILMTMYSDEPVGHEVENFQIQPYEQYVLNNPTRMYGATVLLYPDVMEQLAQGANANLFILPSSIHETILMQDTGELDAQELQAMVLEVNQMEVSPEERLSDEVYYYDKEEHCLSMVTNRQITEELKHRLMQTGDTGMEQESEIEMEE